MMSATELGTFAERAARGAALLDEHEPGWAAKINLDRLEMRSCVRCVLGQIKGHYIIGLIDFGGYDSGRYPIIWGLLRGFNLPDDSSTGKDFTDLADAWRAEIRKRLAGPALYPTEATHAG